MWLEEDAMGVLEHVDQKHVALLHTMGFTSTGARDSSF